MSFPSSGTAGCSSPPGTPDHCNTMTASWGGLGVLWRKPMATIYVRPQRYTFGFIEQSDEFTLSFFGPSSGKRRCLIAVPSVAGTRISSLPAASMWPRLGRLRIFRRPTWSWFAKSAIGTIWTPLTWTPRPCKNTKPKTITACTLARSLRCRCGTDPHPCRREPIPREGGRQ